MLNSDKQRPCGPLYVAENCPGYEHMLRHSFWKIISETGLIHIDELNEMETIVLNKLIRRKCKNKIPALQGDMEKELNILRSAIDKIICHLNKLQDLSRRHQVTEAENGHLSRGRASVNMLQVGKAKDQSSLTRIQRNIKEIGLSPRTARLLESVGINTLEQLSTCSLSVLRNQVRFGIKTIHDIETVLSKYSANEAGN